MAMIRGELNAKNPFTFEKTLQFIDVFSPCSGEQHVERGTLTKAVQIGNRTVALQLSEAKHGGVAYALHVDGRADDGLEDAARDRIAHWLSLGDDLVDFYARAERDPGMAQGLARWRGMHHVKFVTPFEIAVWAVLGQRNPIPLARRTKDAIVEKWGGKLALDGVVHRAFPTAEQLWRVPHDALAAVIRNERRVRYVRAVTEAFLEADERFLRHGDFGRVERWLTDIDGIGAWSSAFILFRGLGRGERMPFTAPMEAAARRAYGPRPHAELQRIGEGYGAHQGYWSLYLRA